MLYAPEDLLVYEYDATIERGLPEAVVLPATTEEVAAAVRIARTHGLPVTARGSGTGLSGGAIPCEGGVVIVTTRMNRILELDAENRTAVVQPGVINLQISQGRRAARPVLRAGPVEPEGLQHRRERGARTPAGRTACATARP